jgi:carbon storage regulator CsrA
MLVLSRRQEEKIVFPNVGITVHLLKIAGKVVRLGVDAPRDVLVLRDELGDSNSPPRRGALPSDRAATHDLCNRLAKVSLALHLFREQWKARQDRAAAATLDQALEHLSKLDQEWVQNNFPAPARGEHPHFPHSRLQCRALVVDDDSNERELLAGLLRMYGCYCDTVADGEAALTYLATQEPPDVVLLDMRMPRCDGPETFRRIRQDRRLDGLKIFAVSSISPDELGIGGVAGVDAWFPKPLNPECLCDALRKAVGPSPKATPSEAPKA